MRSDFPIRAQEDEIVENINLVDANGQSKTLLTSRRADDEIVVDEECVAMHNPHPQCLGFRKRAQVSSLMAPCTDNNQTVDSMSSCFTPEGEELPHCMQVAYTQSSFIHICEGEFADNEHCGTFLEIHRTNGSPYDSETTVINSAKLTKREASGMVTTTMSLFYKGEEDKVLCNFKETVLRLGSMVLIKKNAPVCCCPSNYNTLKKVSERAFERAKLFWTVPWTIALQKKCAWDKKATVSNFEWKKVVVWSWGVIQCFAFFCLFGV